MPAYDLDANSRKAILVFLAAANAEDAKTMLASRPGALSPEDAAIEGGRQDFIRFGCVGCHGLKAEGGLPNPNSQSGQVPALYHVAEDYTKAEVAGVIRNGRTSPVANAKAAPPPLYMPAWKTVLSDEDVARIVEYLWSLKPKETSSW